MNTTLDYKRLFRLAIPEAKPLTFGLVALVISAVLSLAYPKCAQWVVDGLSNGDGAAVLKQAAIFMVPLFLLGGITGGIRAFLFTAAGERVVARLRRDLFSALIHQEIAFFDGQRTGELTNRLSSDTTVVQNAVTVNVSMALRFTIMTIGSVAIMFWTSWKLTLLMVGIVPVVAVGLSIYGRLLRGLSREVQDALAQSSAVAEETLSSARTVRSFARERAEVARYAVAVDRSYTLARKRASLGAVFGGVASFAFFCALGALLLYGGKQVLDGNMSAGQLTSYGFYTIIMGSSVGALAGLWEDLMKAMGSSERIFALLDRAPEVASGTLKPATCTGHVALEDLTFAYPSRPDAVVLRHVNLELRPGQVVALVGPSGGGKSTVAALLSRFYDPQGGRVLLDGHDFRDLDPDWVREQVGVVSQEPVLFATSIEENLRYGRPDATHEEVLAAARAANADEFVSAFPDGYNTLVGERGVRLSGGQKQRIAIARALLKNPRVLILDEATSALDAESEHLVQEALERLMEGRTTLIIAHRLSTVREADRVLVIEGGQVAEEGTHTELLALGGLYKRLVERQFAA